MVNNADADGCTLMDVYAACAEETTSGLSYAGPNYCEMQLGYQLYREGMIDYMELRMLRNALYGRGSVG